MTLEAETKMSLFYYVLASNWIKMKKLVGNEASPKTWAKVIKSCDDYRKTFCPKMSFDDMIKLMKDIHDETKNQAQVFKTMNENFRPENVPLMDLQNFIGSITDPNGLKAYVKYYKHFFDQLSEFVEFLELAKNTTDNS